MTAGPAVTAVIATRNRPEMLRRAVGSVLAQEYPGPVEVIVVFDQSSPDDQLHHDLGEQLRVDRSLRLVVNTRSVGLAGARNTGIDAAAGEFVAFCDDDDEWLPGKLVAQVGALENAHDAWFCAGGYVVDFNGVVNTRLATEGRVDLATLLHGRNAALHPSTFLMRTDRVRQVGLVDEDLPGGYGEDYDLLLQCARDTPILTLAGPLARVYWHNASFFSDRWRMIIDANEYLKNKHEEFGSEPRAAAWLDGKTAFAYAAIGRRKDARRIAWSVLRRRPRQRQALAALGISTGAVTAAQVQQLAQRLGKGV